MISGQPVIKILKNERISRVDRDRSNIGIGMATVLTNTGYRLVGNFIVMACLISGKLRHLPKSPFSAA
jgi:hypothetical protein